MDADRDSGKHLRLSRCGDRAEDRPHPLQGPGAKEHPDMGFWLQKKYALDKRVSKAYLSEQIQARKLMTLISASIDDACDLNFLCFLIYPKDR